MTIAAKERRIQAVKLADALNAIEGVPVSKYAKMLSQCWANGDLTGEQMKEALLASHYRLPDVRWRGELRAHDAAVRISGYFWI